MGQPDTVDETPARIIERGPRLRMLRLVPIEREHPLAPLVRAAARSLERAQKHYAITVEDAVPLRADDAMHHAAIFDALAATKRGDDEMVFGFLDQPVEGNFFGWRDADRRLAFCTIYAWGLLTHLSVRGFVMFQMAAYMLRLSLPTLSFHNDTRGCVQDFCVSKGDFQWKLRTADLCPGCREQFEAALAPDERDALIAMFEAARLDALGRAPTEAATQPLDLAELIEKRYPFPLAVAFRAVQIETRPTDRWLRLIELGDTVFRYIIAVCATLTAGIPVEALPDSINASRRELARPTLGTLHALAVAYFHWLPEVADRCVLPSLARATVLPRGGARRRLLQGLEAFVNTRNASLHGSVSAVSSHDHFERHRSTVYDLLDLLRPWAEFRLLAPVPDSFRARGGRMSWQLRVLHGSNSLFQIEPWETTDRLDTDPLLMDSEGRWMSLFPWLTCEACAHCKHDGVWLYAGWDRRTISRRECGRQHEHTVPLDDAPKAFVNLVR